VKLFESLKVFLLDNTAINPEALLEVFEASPVAVLIMDDHGNTKYSNRAATHLFGYTHDELSSINTALIHPQDIQRQLIAHQSLHKQPKNTQIISIRYIDKAGHLIVANLYITANYDDSGKVIGFIHQIINLSTERQLHADEVLQEMLFYSGDGIYVVDAEFGHILSCNHEGHQRLQYSKQEILRLRVSDISPHFNDDIDEKIPDSAPDFVQSFTWQQYTSTIKQAKTMCIESNHKRKDGTIFPIEINVTYVEKSGREYIVAVVRDISERRLQLENKLAEMNLDPLTKLANRRLFNQKLESLFRKNIGRKAAFLYIDVDKFKSFNDLYGHACGDLVLKHVADSLKRYTREDDIVARFGGDEFLVMLLGIKDDHHLQGIANYLIKALSISLQLQNGITFQCEVSIGGTIQRLRSKDCSSAIEVADKAMYHAKELKGSSFIFIDSYT
jgi:diguanylate cyclase (GGDEF)-like protein/PAS domain S-box-containing protein